MPTRLGLDIGTNSIGWCLYDGDCIRDIGVRIFSDGREPSKGGMPGASLAVTRRVARAMRRRRDRFIGRRSALFDALVTYGLMPDEDAAAKAIEIEDPYVLRAMALDIALTPYQFGRALFHLNQRRGFKSNRKTDRASADPTAGKIAPATKALDAAMTDAKARTLGEFLHGLDTKRVRMRDDGEGYDFYPDRRHYEDEFAKIWEAQSKHHPDVVTEVARVAIHRIIFFQRELKVQVVGVCTFAGLNGVPADERRLPKAHPLFQRRRLYEEVNHLRICRAGEADRVLTLDERNALILKLKSKKTVAFKTLGKTIKLRDGERFNKEGENRKDLTGDEINAEMSAKIRFGSRWPHFSADEQWTILDRLIEEQSPETLHEWLTSTYGLDDEAAQAVAAAKLPDGHGRMGKTATAAILAELEKSVCSYAEAADAAGFHHSDFRTGEALPDLPYYGELLSQDIPPGSLDPAEENDEVRWGKITNPTVHIGLNQLRKLVNAIIRVHGRPDQIVVELARELKLNEKQKKDYNKQLGENTRAAKARGDLLTSMGQSDNGGNRMLVRLWHDLNPDNVLDRRCPYCGEPISAQMLMNGSVDIDHIIPYSRSFDDGASNKVVVHQNCNRQKGNKTPWEWRGDTVHWPIIADQVARLHKSKQWRFAPDAMERVEKDGGFIARQLTDTQYLSRLAGKYLARLYPSKEEGRVYVIPGRMTAMLRRLWGLNDILNDHNYVENRHSNAPKNRLDHRHHAIDAAVIGVTTQGLLQMIAKAAGRAEDQNLDKLFEGLEQPWEGFRDELRQKLGSVTVSHKADHGRRAMPPKGKDVTAARLYNDTAYGFTGETSASGLPIVVHRIPLLSLKPEDLSKEGRIPDKDLQYALYQATEGRSGKDFENALRAFAKRDGPFHGIRRLRVTEPLSVIPVHDKNGRAFKAYKGSSNSHFEVWQLPDGKWQSVTVSTFDAHQRQTGDTRPHPAAKKILSLKQNDLLAMERGGAPREIMVVKQIWPTQINLVGHTEAGKLDDRHKSADDPFRFFAPTASGLKKAKARQIRIDELGRIFDPGPRQ